MSNINNKDIIELLPKSKQDWIKNTYYNKSYKRKGIIKNTLRIWDGNNLLWCCNIDGCKYRTKTSSNLNTHNKNIHDCNRYNNIYNKLCKDECLKHFINIKLLPKYKQYWIINTYYNKIIKYKGIVNNTLRFWNGNDLLWCCDIKDCKYKSKSNNISMHKKFYP